MKVLYFDYWTKGINNFLYFDQKLKSLGFSTRLVHFSSFRGITVPKMEIISGIECIDISYYKTCFLNSVIEKERPHLIIILNIGGLLDRSIMMTGKRLGIRVIYLSHGALVDSQTIDERSFNRFFRSNYLIRLKRFVIQLLPNYIVSTAKYDAGKLLTLYPYKTALLSVLNPAKVIFFPEFRNAYDLEAYQAIVYSDNDCELLLTYGFPRDKIQIVGNPDFDGFLKQYSANGVVCSNTVNPFVLYVDESFVTDRICSLEAHINYLKQIEAIVSSQNYKLAIKLHPRSYKFLAQYESAFPHCRVLTTVDFYQLFNAASFVISNYSSVLLFAMLLCKRIVAPRWSFAAKVPMLYKEGIIEYCATPEVLCHLLSEGPKQESSLRKEYLKRHITFFDGNAVSRINTLIEKAATQAKASA